MRKTLLLAVLVLFAFSFSAHAAEQFTFGGINLSSSPQQVVDKGMSDDYQKVFSTVPATNKGKCQSMDYVRQAWKQMAGIFEFRTVLQNTLSLTAKDILAADKHHVAVMGSNKDFVIDKVQLEGKGQRHSIYAYYLTMPGYKQHPLIIAATKEIVTEVPYVFGQRYGQPTVIENYSTGVGNPYTVSVWENEKEIAIAAISRDKYDNRFVIVDKSAYAAFVQYVISELDRLAKEQDAQRDAAEKAKTDAARSKI